jgi:DNA replication protein DnaC
MKNKKNIEANIIDLSKTLKLSCFCNYKEYIRDGVSTEDILLSILSDELELKENTRCKTRIKNAGFPVLKSLDTYIFDEKRLPNLKKDVIMELAKCEYIKNKSNIIAIGNCGTGKSHIAIALGIEAIYKGYIVKFRRVSDVVNQMSEARSNNDLSKYLKTLNSCDVLILDELGYISFDIESASLLFQVFAARYEVKSIIVTSNLQFSKWIPLLGNDEDMASALVERLVDNSTVLNMNGTGYRIK